MLTITYYTALEYKIVVNPRKDTHTHTQTHYAVFLALVIVYYNIKYISATFIK